MVSFLLGISITLNVIMFIFIYLYSKYDNYENKENKNFFNSFFECNFKGRDFK